MCLCNNLLAVLYISPLPSHNHVFFDRKPYKSRRIFIVCIEFSDNFTNREEYFAIQHTIEYNTALLFVATSEILLNEVSRIKTLMAVPFFTLIMLPLSKDISIISTCSFPSLLTNILRLSIHFLLSRGVKRVQFEYNITVMFVSSCLSISDKAFTNPKTAVGVILRS